MKHLILDNYKNILAIGDNYSTDKDDIDENRIVHILDNSRFDQNFTHITTTETVPTDFAVGIYKYENGFVKNVDQIEELKKQGYDNAVADILGV